MIIVDRCGSQWEANNRIQGCTSLLLYREKETEGLIKVGGANHNDYHNLPNKTWEGSFLYYNDQDDHNILITAEGFLRK